MRNLCLTLAPVIPRLTFRPKLVPDLSPEDIVKYERLTTQRKEITRKIRYMLDDAAMVEPPLWGPCTRCGGTWKGRWPQRKPRCCAKCGSCYWDKDYATPENEQIAKEMKEQKQRQRDPRFLTAANQKNEVQKALETLYRHGITAPPPPNGRSLTPPPPPLATEIFSLPARNEPPQPERELTSVERRSGVTTRATKETTHAEPLEEATDTERQESETQTGGDLQETTAACCSRPLLTDGICLNCGAGLERKVVATDGNNDQ